MGGQDGSLAWTSHALTQSDLNRQEFHQQLHKQSLRKLARPDYRCTYGLVVVRWHGEADGRTGAQVVDIVFTQTERVETIVYIP